MWLLRQSTASQEIPLGPFLDSTDGNSQESGLTINNTDIKLFKSGATSEASKNSGGATHIANGRYYAVLDATDTDTVGPMRVYVHVTGALAVWLDCVVLEEAMYDWLTGTAVPLSPTTAGRTLDVSSDGEAGIDWANIGSPTTTVNLSGTTVKTATDIETDTADIQTRLPAALVSGRIDASVGAMAANTLTASALATDAVSEIQNGLSTAADLATVATYIDTEVAAIKAKTDNLPESPAATGDAMTLTSGERDAVATALLDLANGVETSETVRQFLRLLRAVVLGKSAGGATATNTFRDRADSKNRITATVDADGNRTAVTTDAT